MTGNSDSGEQQSRPFAKSLAAHPDCFTVVSLLAILSMPAIPGAWLAAVPLIVGYCLWMAVQKHRLPFRLPMSWPGYDFGSPLPGGARGYRRGEGLLFLGNDFDTNEELWISNSDARRHALVLATTGAGKALPDDTLVLTPEGWRRNCELRPGGHVMHPSGIPVKILSVHPQGKQPVVRLEFADGRMAECSRDHLWRVRLRGGQNATPLAAGDTTGVWSTSDIGIAIGLGALQGGGSLRVFVALPRPMPGVRSAPELTVELAEFAAGRGLDQLDFMPSLSGNPKQRMEWFGSMARRRGLAAAPPPGSGWLKVAVLSDRDGFLLRQLIWSLGGAAVQVQCGDRQTVRFSLPGQERLFEDCPPFDRSLAEFGLEVTAAEGFPSGTEAKELRRDNSARICHGALSADARRRLFAETCSVQKRMTCIRTDAPDGMFVTECYLPTHNTEFLLGLASQSLMWASGFMFIDGKGTTEFHAKAWSIVSRFGRQDDYRILNFTDSGGTDVSAGGPDVQSNSLNPFAHGSADQLMNLIVSLMGDTGSAGEMWRHRAMALVTSTMKALCEMRDAGDILLDVQAIRDFLPLGYGVKQTYLGGQQITDIAQIPDEAWDELRRRGGLIELYLRALKGEFSEKSRLALKGFFDSLPGFSIERALNGEPQEGKAAEQHGFLSMQLTKPLGSLADDFGHIFRTPYGEVDIDDVVLNRRVLVVLLPALQKAPEEMRNCGRIVVAMLKMMMGRAAGSRLEGTKTELVDSRPTASPSPFVAVLDEAGYYMVKGIDTMMAQARSLGFMIVIAGQDMASMQSVSPQVAETAAANARLTVAGATEDAHRTWEFLRRKFAHQRIAVAAGKTAKPGLVSTKWVNRPDRQYIQQERVPIAKLQKLREGEFYFLMESKLVKARAFYIGECWTPWLAINKFLAIRGPFDPSSRHELTEDRAFLDAVGTIGRVLLDPAELERRESNYVVDPHDGLHIAALYSEKVLARTPERDRRSGDIRDAALLGLIYGTELRATG